MDKKKKNLLIGGLLAVVLLLAVGYAAFATNLNINGTSSIDSRWDVHIKDNGVSVKSSTMATNVNAQKDSQLTASFECNLTDPGVSTISYDVIVENSGTFGAKLSSITLTGTTAYIDATTEGIEVGDVIAAGGEDTLTVTVSYKNVSTVPTGEDATANITVTLNYIQDDGSAVATTSGGSNSGLTTVYAFHTANKCIVGECETTEGYSTVITDGIADYHNLSSYQNGKNWFLKYEIDDENTIQHAWACIKYDFIDDPICAQGGKDDNGNTYLSANQAYLADFDSEFRSRGGACDVGEGYGYCIIDNIKVQLSNDGYVVAYNGGAYHSCQITSVGRTFCYDGF